MGLTACGYKAPLYLPTAEQKQKLQEREERIKPARRRPKQKNRRSGKRPKTLPPRNPLAAPAQLPHRDSALQVRDKALAL
ncbi:hypothetical protein TKWG_23930 [Advenella kashmirensis WT001]|uniref:Uncharacterized protein n=1 Tax=Advenella kashmirensis (strain DSM 17095 / LMG 22695 / WT001) TaxID=1036672 RepID=I3UH79_ADVKW|nr:lipoprotein [Advenella kashmirensis]AFK64367.1 hypothetical protein TKWG_23930 [Advenella kashmirensis WT001]